MMYITVSYIIEKITGTWLGDFLKERIYEPLNMTSTFFSLTDAKAAVSDGFVSLAQGYFWVNNTQEYLPVPHMDSPIASGAGATISTVHDYAKWVRCLMTGSPPLSPSGHEALRFPRIARGFLDKGFRGPDSYALGLGIMNYRGEVLIWHNGGLPGFGTFMAFLPRLQWGAVMMANTVDGGSAVEQVLFFKLLDDLLDVSEKDRFNWEVEMESGLETQAYVLEHAREFAYPDAPDPPVPLTLPLEDYAGIYSHPAYPTVNLSITEGSHDSQIAGDLYTLSYHTYIFLQHVSGEFFLLYARTSAKKGWDPAKDSRPAQDAVTKAEFRLGENGKVRELGVIVEPEMGNEKIWWRKDA
ncbi:hypothetical protein P7C71_g3185, partial [Lecanoromycetidae sp. Uapishka_2]